MSYCLVAYAPWEGLRVAVTGTRGRVEMDIEETVTHLLGDGQASNSKGAFRKARIRVFPMFDQPYELDVPKGEGGHGGADPLMLEQIFSPTPPADPFRRTVSHVAGAASVLSRVVFNIALPALLFDSLSHVELPPSINWVYLITYYTVVLFIFWLGMWLSKRWFATPKKEQGIFGLGSAYSNLMLVGLPIILAGLGEEALLPLFLLVSIHSAVLFLLTAVLAEGGEWNPRNATQLFIQSARGLIRNPIVIAITLGLLVNLLGSSLPALLDETLSTLSQSIWLMLLT